MMEAYVSDSTGVALIYETQPDREEGRWSTMRLTQEGLEEQRVSSADGLASVRETGITDWDSLSGTNRDAVRRALEVARDGKMAVAYIEACLDPMTTPKHGEECAAHLDRYLQFPDLRRHVENIIHARTVPHPFEIEVAVARSEDCTETLSFFTALQESAEAITGVNRAWQKTVVQEALSGPFESTATSTLARKGVFTDLTQAWKKAVAQGTAPEEIRAACEKTLGLKVRALKL